MTMNEFPVQENKQDGKLLLVLITGLSGAGKSLALKRMEDIGFYCADNLPFRLLPGFVEQCRAAEPMLYLAAVVIDGREAAFGTNWEYMQEILDKLDVNLKIIFLDCKDDVLLRRYRETRRRHPLAGGGDIHGGILRERALLQTLRDRAHAVIDTSRLMPLELMDKLGEALSLETSPELTLCFMSFGYKRGLPIDADIVIDMRFLPNPFYDSELRPLSGKDGPVREFLMRQPGATDFFSSLEDLLLFMAPGYAKQGKQQLAVAFGCTGGRHRSVLAAEEMAQRFSGKDYTVRIVHRDFQAEAKDIHGRFTPGEDRP